MGFAHRGAKAHARENTLNAFSMALELGATGLESDAWLTADGEVVLDHDGWMRSSRWGRRKRFVDCNLSEMPKHVPSLKELFATCGSDFQLSLDLKDPNAADAVIRAIDVASDAAGTDLRPNVWLCHPDLAVLTSLKVRYTNVQLCNSTRLKRLTNGPERRACELTEAGIGALNMHQSDWTGGLVTLFHRFGLFCFGWDAQHPRVLNELLDMGIDAVYSDHTDRMMAAITRWYPN